MTTKTAIKNVKIKELFLPEKERNRVDGGYQIDVGIALRNADHINPDHCTLMNLGSFYFQVGVKKALKQNGILEKQGCTKKLYQVKQIYILGGES